MTPDEKDRLREQVQAMSTEELRLLWRWIMLEWASRTDHSYYEDAATSSQAKGEVQR